ncbi:MAG: alpha/beta fold hydrolase [Anaerolineales bacterium]
MNTKQFAPTKWTSLLLLLVLLFLAACQDVEEPTELAATLETTIRETVQPEATEEPVPEPTQPAPTDVPPTPEPTAELVPAYEPVFEPAECWFDTPADVSADCGYLVVPEDRSKPDGRTVRLATVIFRAPGGSPEPDPIMHLHGGPAGAPILSFQFGEYGGYAALTATNRDVIVFDQRGSGLSEPNLQCPEYVEANIDTFDLEVNGEQVSHSEAQQIVLDAALECEERLSEIVDLNMYTTFESARDVNDMRIALGYDLVNIHGESYGTELAQVYVNTYPETIRSVVLDAVEGPTDVYDVWPIALGSSLNQTLADCAADEACNAAFPNLHEVLMDTLSRLDESPVVINGLNRLTGEEVPVLLDRVAVETILWRFSYGSHNLGFIPQLIYELSEGKYDTAASIYGGIALAIQFTEWGTFFSINCNAQLPFSDLDQFRANAENNPEFKDFFLDGTILGQFVYPLCEEWDSGIAPDPRDTFETDLPTLVIGGNNDPATPPQSPVEIMAGLSNGFGPYIFPGMGHVVSLTDYECPISVTLSFIIDPTAEPDTRCISEMAIDFAIPGEAGEVKLEPYTNEEAGFSTVIPVGWQELQAGVNARGNPAVDPTIFGQLAAPTAESEAVLGQILVNLGVAELPETPVRTLDSESLSWAIYLVTGDPSVAVALAEAGDITYIIIMQAPSGEFDGLADTLLVPAILALTPAE